MTSNEKTFYYYFKENMIAMGLFCPETLFEKATTAATNIALITAYIEANKSVSITIGEAFKAIGNSLKCTRGAFSVNALLKKISITALEIGAVYYVGACIGSFAVASVKCYSDFGNKATAGNKSFSEPEFYSVADLSYYANKYKMGMNSAVQKTLHKNRVLCKNHLRATQ